MRKRNVFPKAGDLFWHENFEELHEVVIATKRLLFTKYARGGITCVFELPLDSQYRYIGKL